MRITVTIFFLQLLLLVIQARVVQAYVLPELCHIYVNVQMEGEIPTVIVR